MCLSVSGRLRLRRSLSQDSLQTALIAMGGMIQKTLSDMKRQHLIYLVPQPPDFLAGHPIFISSATIASR